VVVNLLQGHCASLAFPSFRSKEKLNAIPSRLKVNGCGGEMEVVNGVAGR
jgi:hypothetical protein